MDPSIQQELIALEILAESEVPVGAARLVSEWRAVGLVRGEATAGRFLRKLDEQGYTTLLNQKLGRVLSEEGAVRLTELRRLVQTTEAERELQRALSYSSTDELMDLLMVRRLVESETARLAAIRATDDDRQRILDASASCCWDDDESSAASSLDFHFAVAVASHSPLLIAVMRLLLDPSRDQLEIMLSGLTRSSGISERLRDEHLEIANLVIAGESDAASVAMSQHFDHLIEQSGIYLPHQV